MGKISFALSYIAYYFLARHMPGSDVPYSMGSKKFRAFLVRRMFASVGRNVNIEHGAFFASGRDIEIGDNSGLGLNCRVAGPLSIGNDVMMAPGVSIYTQNHETENIYRPMRLQTAAKKKWVCQICGYEYDGDTLPEDFVCPLCKHGASDFALV